MSEENKTIELNEEDLKKVSGGITNFEESAIHVGVCIQVTNKSAVGFLKSYYLVVGDKQANGSYPCKVWSVMVQDHKIIENGVSRYLPEVYLSGNQMICSICDNPPSFVHM